MQVNPAVCVILVDVLTQKGFKIHRKASARRWRDQDFRAFASPLGALARERFPFASLFVMDVRNPLNPLVRQTISGFSIPRRLLR